MYSGCAARETGGASCIYAKLVDDRQNVTSGENQVFLALVLDLGAAVAGARGGALRRGLRGSPPRVLQKGAVFFAARCSTYRDAT